ncbi:MAG TPA: DUF1844 domain-containing protein [Haliangiales bacterium]|nr:DUF1844 domain-containing protein [Haliangiales bacterium]
MTEPFRSLPDIDFATFVLSLASSVLVYLGESDGPEGDAGDKANKGTIDLPLAKQTIDIMAMLQEKTKGNLTEAEDRLLAGVLYDLRIKYVDAHKRR